MSGDATGTPEDEGADSDSPHRTRLDPERAAAARRSARHPRPQVVDTRPYQRLLGLFGLLLVIVISVTFLTSHKPGTAGVPAGQRLPLFSAPLAVSNLEGAANLNPPCTEARHHRGVLNVCLLVKQAPLVLAFFVTSSSGCEREVGALQVLARRFRNLKFAAVAVRSSHVDAARAVRQHGWSIPVAYDVDGRVGAAAGIEVCPIVELVRRGGIVTRRLIGEHWSTAAALAPPVRALATRG